MPIMVQQTAGVQAGYAGESGERLYFNPWREFCAQLPQFIDEVHAVRQRALNQHKPGTRNASHRGFYVATLHAAYSYGGEENSLVWFTAINSKPRPDSEGICSELRTTTSLENLNMAAGQHYDTVGLVVMGEPQPDQATGYETGTLFVCSERCWPKIIEPGRITHDGLIATVRPDRRKAQVQTAGELDEFYSTLRDGERPIEPPLVDHDTESWGNVVNLFDQQIPRDLDPFSSLDARSSCVEAARVAIQGGFSPLRRVV